MSVVLGDLQSVLGISSGNAEVEILGCTNDSRAVEPGFLFCAVPGAVADGHDFVGSALERGAAALLVERSLGLGVPELIVPNVRRVLGPVSSVVYGNPSARLSVIGVTGTNGKTTVTELLKQLSNDQGRAAASIGTLTGARTTPEAPELQSQLAELVEGGVEVVALEVSSHALAMGRVAGTNIRVGVFTNLGRDHLDYHRTTEEYFAAKALLFTPEMIDVAVIGRDDRYGQRLISDAAVPTVSFGLADAEGLAHEGTGTRFRWRGHQVSLGLAGSHNVLNALAALTAGAEIGLDPASMAQSLAASRPPRGRFEFVESDAPFAVVVDYAHTPDALKTAYGAARSVVSDPAGRVLVVFGCGGDRDRAKRPEMGEAAERLADRVIVTSDNPRSEDPRTIIEEILGGLSRPDQASVVESRALAIGQAIGEARPHDVVLIAGKGHETTQTVGSVVAPFDDRAVAADLVEARILGGATEKMES